MPSNDELNIKLRLAIGDLVIQFSSIEYWMKRFINLLIDAHDHKVGEHISSDMPFTSLYHTLMSLYRYREIKQSRIKQLEKLLKKIKNLRKKRNNIIHSKWYLALDKQSVTSIEMTSKFAKGLEIKRDKYKLTDIEDLNLELLNHAVALVKILSITQRETYERKKQM